MLGRSPTTSPPKRAREASGVRDVAAVDHAAAGRPLADTRALAAQLAQVVELGATDVALANQLNAVDAGAVEREYALDAFAVADLADGEAGVHAGVPAGDANALIGLDALARAFDDLHVDAQRITGRKLRYRPLLDQLLDLFGLKLLNDVHRTHPLP